jgi:hypothetical protein
VTIPSDVFGKSVRMNREIETRRRRGMSCVTMVAQHWKQIDYTFDSAEEMSLFTLVTQYNKEKVSRKITEKTSAENSMHSLSNNLSDPNCAQ